MTDLHQTPAPPDAPVTKHGPDAGGAAGPTVEETGTHPVRLLILGALVALAFASGGWALPLVILGVVVMIFLHELGHFLAAKFGGMKVTEFFIGFGPKIWSFRRGETEYGLKAIPAGAYVKVIGMNNLDEVEPGEEHRAYRNATYPKRFLLAVAGSAMHFAQALVLLIVLYTFVGIPGGSLTETQDWAVDRIVEDSQAEAAGLQVGDQIVELDGGDISTFDSFASDVSERAGDDVALTVVRDGNRIEVPATIGREGERGLLGIGIEPLTTTTGPITAVTSSVSDFWAQTTATLGFLGDFFTPSGISEFGGTLADGGNDAGPVVDQSPSGAGASASADNADEGRIISIVGAVRIGADLTETGMLGFLLFFIGINITIGIFNLLPLLPLDGGHVVVATYERIREFWTPKGERYHVDFARLIPVVYAVFTVLVLLGVTTIYLDIVNPISL